MQRKWEVLSQKLIREKKYFPGRLTPRLLSSRFYANRAVIHETREETGDRTIHAYAALWPAYRGWIPDWYELGTVWVGEELRGNGLSRIIMARAINLAPDGTNLFLITKEESVKRIARSLGFVSVEETDLNVVVWACKVCIVQRLPGSLLRKEERELFIRMNKAHAE